MSESRQRPLLFLNPADDPAFRRCVDEAMAERPREPVDLEHRLRDQFPDVIVRPRDLASERLPVWYVYRDGRWVGRVTGSPPRRPGVR